MRVMQGKSALSQRLNLTGQIQVCKNYYQHRRRLDLTRYKEPMSMKKSISFDEHKEGLFNELKNRKLRTTQFNKKQQTRKNEEQDAIMLGKILEYDRRLFVFSLKTERPNNTLLHHHSRVAQFKKEEKIEEENERIHFRITHAKSLYNKDSIHSSTPTSKMVRTFLLRKNHSASKINIKRRSAQKFYTENEEEEEQGLIKNISQFSNIGRLKQDLLRVGTSESQMSLKDKGKTMGQDSRLLLFTNNSSLCDRVRKEKLACKLYEKKLRFQNTIMSRLQRKK